MSDGVACPECGAVGQFDAIDKRTLDVDPPVVEYEAHCIACGHRWMQLRPEK